MPLHQSEIDEILQNDDSYRILHRLVDLEDVLCTTPLNKHQLYVTSGIIDSLIETYEDLITDSTKAMKEELEETMASASSSSSQIIESQVDDNQFDNSDRVKGADSKEKKLTPTSISSIGKIIIAYLYRLINDDCFDSIDSLNTLSESQDPNADLRIAFFNLSAMLNSSSEKGAVLRNTILSVLGTEVSEEMHAALIELIRKLIQVSSQELTVNFTDKEISEIVLERCEIERNCQREDIWLGKVSEDKMRQMMAEFTMQLERFRNATTDIFSSAQIRPEQSRAFIQQGQELINSPVVPEVIHELSINLTSDEKTKLQNSMIDFREQYFEATVRILQDEEDMFDAEKELVTDYVKAWVKLALEQVAYDSQINFAFLNNPECSHHLESLLFLLSDLGCDRLATSFPPFYSHTLSAIRSELEKNSHDDVHRRNSELDHPITEDLLEILFNFHVSVQRLTEELSRVNDLILRNGPLSDKAVKYIIQECAVTIQDLNNFRSTALSKFLLRRDGISEHQILMETFKANLVENDRLNIPYRIGTFENSVHTTIPIWELNSESVQSEDIQLGVEADKRSKLGIESIKRMHRNGNLYHLGKPIDITRNTSLTSDSEEGVDGERGDKPREFVQVFMGLPGDESNAITMPKFKGYFEFQRAGLNPLARLDTMANSSRSLIKLQEAPLNGEQPILLKSKLKRAMLAHSNVEYELRVLFLKCVYLHAYIEHQEYPRADEIPKMIIGDMLIGQTAPLDIKRYRSAIDCLEATPDRVVLDDLKKIIPESEHELIIELVKTRTETRGALGRVMNSYEKCLTANDNKPLSDLKRLMVAYAVMLPYNMLRMQAIEELRLGKTILFHRDHPSFKSAYPIALDVLPVLELNSEFFLCEYPAQSPANCFFEYYGSALPDLGFEKHASGDIDIRQRFGTYHLYDLMRDKRFIRNDDAWKLILFTMGMLVYLNDVLSDGYLKTGSQSVVTLLLAHLILNFIAPMSPDEEAVKKKWKDAIVYNNDIISLNDLNNGITEAEVENGHFASFSN